MDGKLGIARLSADELDNNSINEKNGNTNEGNYEINEENSIIRANYDEERANCDEESPLIKKPKPLAFLKTGHFWIILFLGQILSLCITGTNTFTELLVTEPLYLSVPTLQSLFNYVLLNIVYTSYTIYKYGFAKYWKMIRKDFWRYIILAAVDVEGNYFVVKAYEYTDLLSAELLDAWAIVAVVIISFVFLKVRYHWTQIAGICVCLGGLGMLVGSDALTGKNYSAPDKLKGDLFMILGATFYGISNTLEEYLVSKRPLYETVGQLGFWATIINGVQTAIIERNAIKTGTWNGKSAGYLIGFTGCMFILYSFTPILFRMSSAAFYNLSLLTSDYWGLIVGLILFNYSPYFLYFIAFAMVIIGVTIYYTVVRTIEGEARKPWLKSNEGVVGIGTYARNNQPAQMDEHDQN